MNPRNFSLLLPFALVVAGCDDPFAVEPEYYDPADCVIESAQKNEYSFSSPPTITVTIRNVSDVTAYEVGCTIKLITGDAIVDESYV